MPREDYQFVTHVLTKNQARLSPPLGECECVKIYVHIRNNATGKVRVYLDDGSFDEDTGEVFLYPWTDGNYSCDCNREIFFDNAGGIERDWADYHCSEDRFSVNIYASNGKLVYQEFEEEK